MRYRCNNNIADCSPYSQYLLTAVETALVDFFSLNLLSTTSGDDIAVSLRRTITNLCIRLLPQAVNLTDVFGYSDWELDRYVLVGFLVIRRT